MKNKLILVCLLLPIILPAQKNWVSPMDIKYYESVLGENDKDFEVTKSPQKWATEPVVALCQKLHIGFLTISRSTKVSFRKRIKIQDKYVLPDYSIYYFQESAANDLYHIKSNGTKIKINLDNGIPVDGNIPKFFGNGINKSSYRKITIPNLEVGDILDYFEAYSENFSNYTEIIANISYDYPIIKQQIIIDVDEKYTVHCNAFNISSKFIEDPAGGLNARGERKKSIKRMALTDQDRPAQKKENWVYENRTTPIIKLLGVQKLNPKWGDLNTTIKEKVDLKFLFEGHLKSEIETIKSILIKKINNKHKHPKTKKATTEEKVNNIYQALKISFFETDIANGRQSNFFRFHPENPYFNEYNKLYDVLFSQIFLTALDELDIISHYVAAVPRHYCKSEDVLLPKEIEIGVYVKSLDKYYWAVDNYRVAGEPVSSLAGTKAFLIDNNWANENENEYKYEEINIPTTFATDHLSTTVMDIDIRHLEKRIDFTCKSEFTGAFKNIYNQILLQKTNHLAKERETYTKNKRTYTETKNEKIEEWYRNDFDIDEFKSYELTSFGTTSENPNLKIEAKFNSNKYINKAGPHLIFSIGKLIGAQTQLDEEEIQERIHDVNYDYARSIINKINITLPTNLKAHGLDALNMNIDNKNGSFVSSVKQEGNILMVETTKTYKNQTVPKEEWNDLVEMLEAAYKFSQLKIILKK